MSEPTKDMDKNKADKSEKRVSSHGDSPDERIPKDVSPENATWKDRNERNTTSNDEDERTDALLDEGSDLSFPASDPIAVSSPTKLVKGKDGKMHPETPKQGNQ
jgi:hypothetical protein